MVAASAPTLIRRELRERRLLEFAQPPAGKSRVDRQKGIIYGVKIVGRHSVNTHGVAGVDGTEYTRECLFEAAPLYNVEVNVDHPRKKDRGEDRSARDRFAWLEEAHLEGDEGIFGNLHFLDPADPLAVKMMRAAELRPTAYALSHNAWGEGDVRGGKYVVTHIPEVRSVDIVADGGTNRSLFEGREKPIKTTPKALLEKALPALKAGRQKRARALLESKAPVLLREAEEGDGTDYRDHLHAAKKMCEDAGDYESATKIHKLMAPAKPDEDEDDSGDDDTGAGEAGEEKESKKAMESRLAELEAREGCRQLCEAEGYQPSAVQLAELVELSAARRKARVGEWKELRDLREAKKGGPKSRSLHTEPKELKESKEVQEQRESLWARIGG